MTSHTTHETVSGAHVGIVKTVEYFVTMPAGEYYITDPCYCFESKTWDELGNLTNWWQDKEKPVFEFRGKPLLSFSTKWGDGCFTDQQGFEYGVDAGMIGLVHIEIADKVPPENMSRKATFLRPFRCTIDDGVLRFGDIKIDTN